MEINKILSSDILDLVFEDRNKAYGAYELRKTYKKRLTIALLCTAAVALLALGGSLLASSLKKSEGKIQVRERSEEHTSELQSQSNLVCRLLLEKKKKKKKKIKILN